jgi:hypothetical protein
VIAGNVVIDELSVMLAVVHIVIDELSVLFIGSVVVLTEMIDGTPISMHWGATERGPYWHCLGRSCSICHNKKQ